MDIKEAILFTEDKLAKGAELGGNPLPVMVLLGMLIVLGTLVLLN